MNTFLSKFGLRHGRAAATLGPRDLFDLIRGHAVEVSVLEEYVLTLALDWRKRPATFDLGGELFPGGPWALTDRDELLKPAAELAAEQGVSADRILDVARRMRVPVVGPRPEVSGYEEGAVLRADVERIVERLGQDRNGRGRGHA